MANRLVFATIDKRFFEGVEWRAMINADKVLKYSRSDDEKNGQWFGTTI